MNHRIITQQAFTTTLIMEGEETLGIQGGLYFSNYSNLEKCLLTMSISFLFVMNDSSAALPNSI